MCILHIYWTEQVVNQALKQGIKRSASFARAHTIEEEMVATSLRVYACQVSDSLSLSLSVSLSFSLSLSLSLSLSVGMRICMRVRVC